jgi:TfoX/Sxy family transcriptional regulator of competence genes
MFMSADQSFINYVVEQMGQAGLISFKKMFGGCTIYLDGKVVALIVDDQLFIKPTESGRIFIDDVEEVPPYPGAKKYFLIDDKIDDGDWLSQLATITAKELPEPKVKKRKK